MDHVIKIGEDLRDFIMKRLKKIDDLKSKIKNNKKKKRNYLRAIRKHYRKIHNMRNELHFKTCLYLCEHYDRIVTTTFSSKKVSNKKGNLNKDSKRVLGILSHYKFRQRLSQKCEEYGCLYKVVNEDYTSKTCGSCGNVKKDLGDAHIYECKICGTITDRDVNAARNILIKNINELIKKY